MRKQNKPNWTIETAQWGPRPITDGRKLRFQVALRSGDYHEAKRLLDEIREAEHGR